MAMDMWPGCMGAVERQIPEASKKICFDKFQLAQHLGDAVDRVRRQEHRVFLSAREGRLKGSKYL